MFEAPVHRKYGNFEEEEEEVIVQPQQKKEHGGTALTGAKTAEQENGLQTGTVEKTDCPVRTQYEPQDIINTAWKIVEGDPNVKDALLFYSRIKHNIPEKDWDVELAKFFTGERSPKLKKKKMDVAAFTPASQLGKRTQKKIRVNTENDFGEAVSSFLHEMCHYIDIWYSSKAGKESVSSSIATNPSVKWGTGKKYQAETTGGITPYKTASEEDKSKKGNVDPATNTQVSAMEEYLTANLTKLMTDIEAEPKEDDDEKLKGYRELFKKYLQEETKTAEKTSKTKEGETIKTPEQIKEEARNNALTRIQNDILDEMILLYDSWGITASNYDKTSGYFDSPDGTFKLATITGTGLELGYAFEKQAYGFYNSESDKGTWSVDFAKKFKDKYCDYLK